MKIIDNGDAVQGPEAEWAIDDDVSNVTQGRRRTPQVTTAAELRTMTFAPLKYIVPDILAEGVTLFAGNPKVGKSWLALDVAVAVARGGYVLGDKKCDQGAVLYLALEDNKRRLQRRLDKIIGSMLRDWPADLRLATEWQRLDAGALDDIREWIASVERPRLVVIDTLAMIRVSRGDKQSNYEADYGAIQGLREIASDTGVAILVIHHNRKQAADTDVFERVSGTYGLSGAADAVLILDRDSNGVTLHGRGRDVEEIEKAIQFDRRTCRWRILGDAAAVRMTGERNVILAAMRQAKEPMMPKDIAAAVGKRVNSVTQTLGRMVKKGEVVKDSRGRYRVPEARSGSGPEDCQIGSHIKEPRNGEDDSEPQPSCQIGQISHNGAEVPVNADPKGNDGCDSHYDSAECQSPSTNQDQQRSDTSDTSDRGGEFRDQSASANQSDNLTDVTGEATSAFVSPAAATQSDNVTDVTGASGTTAVDPFDNDPPPSPWSNDAVAWQRWFERHPEEVKRYLQ